MIPEKVIVEASGSFKPGLAIVLIFKSSVKNDFHYTVFLNDDGRAQIDKSELLAEFDQTRNFFLMDFGDPRVVFKGQIDIRVWSRDEVEKAIIAYSRFKSRWKFRPNYLDDLQKALTSNGESDCHIRVEQISAS